MFCRFVANYCYHFWCLFVCVYLILFIVFNLGLGFACCLSFCVLLVLVLYWFLYFGLWGCFCLRLFDLRQNVVLIGLLFVVLDLGLCVWCL